MPIKPFELSTNNYESIPNEEDVTPVDRTIAKKAKKSIKYIVCGVLVVATAVVFMYLGLAYESGGLHPIRIYQTSLTENNYIGLKKLSPSDSDDVGLSIKSFSFGNTECDSSKSGYKCGSSALSSAKLIVDTTQRFQTIIGFGGAFTEASAINFYGLPQDRQDKVIDLYFGSGGIGLTLGRIHINSCDFSPQSYSFDDIAGDYDLTYFDWEVTHDNAKILPMIRLAQSALAGHGRALKLLASPWSPPAWMKRPVDGVQSMTGSALPNGLKDDHKTMLAWANYISKFIGAYENKGAPIWAVTPQNEPEFAAPWEACAFNASFERYFIRDYLGPVLKTQHPELLLLGFDHNKDHLEAWTHALLGGDAAEFVDGMAFHWYGGLDRVTDGTYGYDAVNASHHFAPNKLLLGTEGCSCPGVKLGDWLRAERLGHDIMFDLLNHAQGWIDWNLLVDASGGPNHLDNNCDASLVVNQDSSDVHVQPKYFYLGHFSKFVTPDSVRVRSSIVGDFGFQSVDPNVQAGLEVGMFACEKSVRQVWMIDSKHSDMLQLSSKAEYDDQSGADMLCVVQGAWDRPVLKLANCALADRNPETLKEGEPPLPTFLRVHLNEAGQLFDTETGRCVGLRGDVREPGALLELQACLPPSKKTAAHQHFQRIASTGEIVVPEVDPGLCLTAGWPLLNAVAFHHDRSKTTTVVVMNEASVPASIALTDSAKSKTKVMGFNIPPRSMQTIVY